MRAGPLRHRITLQAFGNTTDAVGLPVRGWTDLATVWADVRFPGGLEALKADAAIAVTKASIRIRYRPGITAAMRVRYDGKIFDVRAVLPDSTGRRYLDFVAETGANNG